MAGDPAADPRYLALIAQHPERHNSLCPVWLRRKEGSTYCTCWRRAHVQEQLNTIDADLAGKRPK